MTLTALNVGRTTLVLNRRAAVLAVLAAPLGYYKAFAAQAGWLTIDLDNWKGIHVVKGNEVIELTAADIFKALAE